MDQCWTWSASNAGDEPIILLLEPWAEEFEIPPRSVFALTFSSNCELTGSNSIERAADYLMLWIEHGTAEVRIDGIFLQTGSATIPIPDLTVIEKSVWKFSWQRMISYLRS